LRSIVGKRRHCDLAGAVEIDAVPLSCALIGSKKEKSFSPYGAGKIETKLMLLQYRPRLMGQVAEKTVRIQRIVSEKLPKCSVKIFCARLCDQIHIGSSIAAERGIVLACLHLEFLDRVGIGNRDAAGELRAALQIIDADSIHLEIVIEDRCAVRNESWAGWSADSRS